MSNIFQPNVGPYSPGGFTITTNPPPPLFQTKTPKVKALDTVKLSRDNMPRIAERAYKSGVDEVLLQRSSLTINGVEFKVDTWIVEDNNPLFVGSTYRAATDDERREYLLG